MISNKLINETFPIKYEEINANYHHVDNIYTKWLGPLFIYEKNKPNQYIQTPDGVMGFILYWVAYWDGNSRTVSRWVLVITQLTLNREENYLRIEMVSTKPLNRQKNHTLDWILFEKIHGKISY